MKSELLRIAVHAAFYPALWFNRALCAIGIWEQSAWVTPNLAIGSLPSAGDLRRMAAEGVTAVVNMCEEYGGNVTLLASLGVGQLHLPTLDYHCPSEPHLLSGIPYIRDRLAEGGKVLVHCKAGRGRSAIMILCYLMAERRISAAAALEILRRARPQHARSCPSPSRAAASRRQLATNLGESVERGLCSEFPYGGASRPPIRRRGFVRAGGLPWRGRDRRASSAASTAAPPRP
ncbi:MAG: hypothetical protein DCC65_11245 [Planctomycetota bacterium]|nr:MAG: hypothetical protein DCC65_11245 [Planctomycetota bacterium]